MGGAGRIGVSYLGMADDCVVPGEGERTMFCCLEGAGSGEGRDADGLGLSSGVTSTRLEPARVGGRERAATQGRAKTQRDRTVDATGGGKGHGILIRRTPEVSGYRVNGLGAPLPLPRAGPGCAPRPHRAEGTQTREGGGACHSLSECLLPTPLTTPPDFSNRHELASCTQRARPGLCHLRASAGRGGSSREWGAMGHQRGTWL